MSNLPPEAEKEDIVLLILYALTAYGIENDEPLSVDQEILQNIIESNLLTGFVPQVALNNDDGRLRIAVTMRAPERDENTE